MIKARFVMHKVVNSRHPEPQIQFSGFKVGEEGYWEVPKKLEEVLQAYGFEQQSDAVWTAPFDVEGFGEREALECVADFTEVELRGWAVKRKKGFTTVFRAVIDGDGDTMVENRDPMEALNRAYVKWNRMGRSIKRVPALLAVQKVLKELNS